MATLSDLRKCITDLPPHEAIAIVIKVRENRRNRVIKQVKEKKTKKKDITNLNSLDRSALLELMSLLEKDLQQE